MAAKIGILGESTVVTENTETTVYTVPSSKAARIKILWAVEGGAGTWRMSIRIGSPGSEQHIHTQAGSGVDSWSGLKALVSPDPLGSQRSADIGQQLATAAFNLDGPTSTLEWAILPLPETFYLSTGDTVIMDLRTIAAVDLLVQVVGVEDDA